MPLDAKVRYQKKISLLENIDSYQIDEWTEDKYCLAEVQHEDIVNFLLFSTSYYIFEEMKAFKIIQEIHEIMIITKCSNIFKGTYSQNTKPTIKLKRKFLSDIEFSFEE